MNEHAAKISIASGVQEELVLFNVNVDNPGAVIGRECRKDQLESRFTGFLRDGKQCNIRLFGDEITVLRIVMKDNNATGDSHGPDLLADRFWELAED